MQSRRFLSLGAGFLLLALLRPAVAFMPRLSLASTLPEPHLGYGVNVCCQHYDQVREMGFNWVQVYGPPHRRLPFRVLYQVSIHGAWEDLEAWGDELYQLALSQKGYIDAYEIGNEPNLTWEGHMPDPVGYTAILKEAFVRIKQADPHALVIAAGMATTGPAGMEQHPWYPKVWNDLLFIQAMYDAGAKGYFDALGSHPHGFGYPPEQDPRLRLVNGLAFRRVEQQREIMVANGDGDKPILATEWGWLLDPGPDCHEWGDWPSRVWQIVTPEQQADYLVRAFHYADTHWPWMGPMLVFNLDFSMSPQYHHCEPMRWYSILNGDGSPRPAYLALKQMPKRFPRRAFLPLVWMTLPARPYRRYLPAVIRGFSPF